MSDSVDARKVCRACVVSVGDWETIVDLLELDIDDFDVVLGMD